MAFIRLVSDEEAQGALKREYEAAIRRAGRVWNIVRLMGQNPETLKASMTLYGTVMHGPSPLTRAQREMLAVVVSKANDCFYWIEAHLHDLRGEVDNEELVTALRGDFRKASGLDGGTRALLEYAEKLTRCPHDVGEEDIENLRQAGFNDRAITDAVQVISYFNYINRVADGLGVDLEEFMKSS